jgi:hypothetical protein
MLSQSQSVSKPKAATSSSPFTLPGTQAVAKPSASSASGLQQAVQSLVGLSTGGVTGTLLNLLA